MAKIVLMSDSINIPSGFGIQAKYITAALAQAGHEVYALGFAHRGNPQQVRLLPELFPNGAVNMIPNGDTRFGERMLPYWLKKIQPHILITLADVWMTTYIHELDLGSIRWVRYVPFDSEVMLGGWKDQIKATDQLVTFSEFSNKLIKDTCGIECKNIPHGVETDVFKPMSEEDIKKGKVNAGFEPDDFVVGFVGRNQIRKMQPYFFKAFAEFAKDKPDVKCLIHMDINDEKLGWNLDNIFQLLNIKHKVIKTTPSDGFQFKFDIDTKKMNFIFNICDIHYNSGNEGFGVPAMESNAAGTPNINPDYTTAKELTNFGSCGILTKCGVNWVHPVGAEWTIPDHDDLVKWLNYAYEQRNDDLKDMGRKARKYALKKYSWDVVAPQWVEYIEWLLKTPPKVNYATGEYGV